MQSCLNPSLVHGERMRAAPGRGPVLPVIRPAHPLFQTLALGGKLQTAGRRPRMPGRAAARRLKRPQTRQATPAPAVDCLTKPEWPAMRARSAVPDNICCGAIKNRVTSRRPFDFRQVRHRTDTETSARRDPICARTVPPIKVVRRPRRGGSSSFAEHDRAQAGDAAPAQRCALDGLRGRPQRLLPFDSRRRLKITI